MRPARALYFDGETAAARPVQVRLSDDRMALVIEGAGPNGALRWPLPDLRALPDGADRDTLTLAPVRDTGDESMLDAQRLELRDAEAIAWLRRTRPALFSREVRAGTGRRIALWLGGAVAAVAVMLFVILPGLADALARVIPPEREAAFGRTVIGQMERLLGAETRGGLDCADPAGRAALDRMTARLTEGQEIGYDLRVRVFDHDMVNAFAAPGGQVVLIDGLIHEAETPEQVAAVLAHEIGHVVNRDPTRAALRTAGSVGLLGLLFGDFAGGAAILVVAERLIDASYAQAAEDAADRFAHDMLAQAGVPPDALAGMFETFREMAGDTPEILSHFMSHPSLDARIAAAEQATPDDFAARPILDEAEWQALRGICGQADATEG
ncbi:TPR repeat-containing protein YfgC precursor [Roseivivax jejudonensis]|uniref:TPR repeat-containing protein YfgC n=1 Tax=Roseivivax jejudonensis TaxID=1529041 RepID=A0A1X7A480_9RHOB|nr:M48 family metallopeptidase [Roseivivax jejudonensis]SLN70023.1 TPR repeat-containing protein YfgC precursor [Roseivivax jejudonensis]